MPPTLEQEKTLPSGVTETPQATLDRAKAMTGSISANQLAQPVPNAPVTEPAEAPPVNRGVIDRATQGTQEFITAQSAEAARLNQLRDEYGALAGEGSLSDMFTTQQDRFGIPQNMRELQDINTQLAGMGTESLGREKYIARKAGQTINEGGRAITQEKAELDNAIFMSGLAARAQVLQGNIETASTLVNQAVQLAYQDRTLRNTNLINQINDLRGVVDSQTQQILNKEQRAYEADQAKIKQIENSVANALQTGAATASEVSFLTDPNTTDNERLAAAQLIQARGAGEQRDLQMTSARLDIAKKSKELARLNEPTVATRSTSVIEVGGEKRLIDTQTGDVIATFGAGVSTDEIKEAKDIKFTETLDTLVTHPGMSKAVGTTKLARFTPFKADVMSGDVSDFVGSVENVVKNLTLNTYAEAKAQGLTFGAMSEGEWQILGDSATKINNWKRTREDGSVYYDTSEKNFKEELKTLSGFSKLDAINKGTSPAKVGVVEMEDGTMWTQNADGSYTQIK